MSPFRSRSQQAWMFIHKPDVARRWARTYGVPANLPNHVTRKDPKVRLSAAQRNRLPASSFAGPGRSYPISDASHARNALSRVAQFGSPALQSKVRKKVRKRYPKMSPQAHQNIARFIQGRHGG